MDRFQALPLPLLQRVLALVDGRYVVDVLPHTPRLPDELFESLARVSRGWHVLVQQLRAAHDATNLSVHIVHGRDDELRTFVANVRQRGDKLRSLRLRLGSDEFIRSFEIFKARENEQRMDDQVSINWRAVFAMCPSLQRLDLSGIPMHSRHLQRILDAASRECRQLKALIMPKREWHRGPVTIEWLPTMHVLYRALERWYSYGQRDGRRGLLQLSVPQRITRSHTNATIHELADEYLLAVAAFCPDIEYFDGWKDTYQQVDARLLCEELLYCSKSAWLAFCDRCRSIRELNWYVLPFIDDFFDVFAAFPKPNLKRLILAGGDHINFNDNAVFGTYYKDGPWSYSPSRLDRIFQACPALEDLHVTFQLPPFDDGARQDTITDGFLESIARHCPKLRSLVIMELFDADFYGSIEGITDRGIKAIAQLESLQELKLKATYCEGVGLAALLLDCPAGAPERVVKMVVGDDASNGDEGDMEYRAGFYEILAEMLGILLENWQQLKNKRFTVSVHGRHRGRLNSALWRGSVHVLRDKLQARCPWLHISISERHRHVVVVFTTSQPPITVTQLAKRIVRAHSAWWPLSLIYSVVELGLRMWTWLLPDPWGFQEEDRKKTPPQLDM